MDITSEIDRINNAVSAAYTAAQGKGATMPTTRNVASLASTINSISAATLNSIYPVGSIYLSTVATNPKTLFGGTWERVKDVFLLAAGDTYAAGKTGGEAAHTLTVAEMPSHHHGQYVATDSGGNTSANHDYSGWSGSSKVVWQGLNTGDTGGGAAHNNMPPYLTVYAWKRTA
jgi:hypothetical protein